MLRLFLPKTPMRLEAVEMTTRKPEDKEEGRSKALKVTLKMAPFQLDDAAYFPGLKDLLFENLKTGEMLRPGVRAVEWLHGAGLQTLELRTAPDLKKPTAVLLDVAVGSTLKIRRDRETPCFEATITLTCEPTTEDQALITANYTEQLFVTFEETQPSMLEQPVGAAAENRDAGGSR